MYYRKHKEKMKEMNIWKSNWAAILSGSCRLRGTGDCREQEQRLLGSGGFLQDQKPFFSYFLCECFVCCLLNPRSKSRWAVGPRVDGKVVSGSPFHCWLQYFKGLTFTEFILTKRNCETGHGKSQKLYRELCYSIWALASKVGRWI